MVLFNSKMKQGVYFPGLNGIRGIAVIFVLFSHILIWLRLFDNNPIFISSNNNKLFLTAFFLGRVGVDIFFTLSGFLITYLLLKEKDAGKISIKNFYIRRVLRICPLYYLYLFLIIVMMVISHQYISEKQLLLYFFFMPNVPTILTIGFGFAPLLYHYWTIGVEEQFYFFWPWVVKKTKSLTRKIFIVCILLIVIKIIVYSINQAYHGKNAFFLLVNSAVYVMRFQCMLIGAIGAILHFAKKNRFIRAVNNRRTQAVSWLIFVLILICRFHIVEFFSEEVIALLTVFIIIGQIETVNRVVNLETPVLNFIGKISYGIYIIHPLLFVVLPKIIHFSGGNIILNAVIVIVLFCLSAILLGYLSYQFFEKRFLKFKKNFY